MKIVTRISRLVIAVGIPLLIIMVVYAMGTIFPKMLHEKHEYRGYTYYSSRFDKDFKESDFEFFIDGITTQEPKYIYLLDSFYKDGYDIFIDDKFTYGWCTAKPTRDTDESACIRYNRRTGDISAGMFINYKNDELTDRIFFHELTHYLDYKLGNVSQSAEFRDIFNSEYGSSTLSQRPYYSQINEYFAEEGAYFILFDSGHNNIQPNGVRYGVYEDAPRTFEFIKRQLETFRTDL